MDPELEVRWYKSDGFDYNSLHEVDRSLQPLFHELLEFAGYDGRGYPEGDWQSKAFRVQPYVWDCECPNGAFVKGCPCLYPNFEHVKSGFKLDWYKYPLRSSKSNAPLTKETIRSWFHEVMDERLDISFSNWEKEGFTGILSFRISFGPEAE